MPSLIRQIMTRYNILYYCELFINTSLRVPRNSQATNRTVVSRWDSQNCCNRLYNSWKRKLYVPWRSLPWQFVYKCRVRASISPLHSYQNRPFIKMTTEFIPTELAISSATEESEQEERFNLLYLFIIPVIAFTCGANIVVILCVYCYRPLHKPNNYFVASLAVADAVVGVVVMSGMLLYNVYGLWPLSEELCTAWIGIDFSCCTVSMLHLCIIAQDRHNALTKPIEYRSRDRTIGVPAMIALAWVGGFILWVPAVIVIREDPSVDPRDCLFVPGKDYIISQSCLVYGIPIISMLCLYSRCVVELRKHFKKISSIREENSLAPATFSTSHAASEAPTCSTSETFTHTLPGEEPKGTTKHSSHKHSKEHKRSVRTLGVVIAVFLFCWAPFCVLWPAQSWCNDCIPIGFFTFTYWATYLNSTINPCLWLCL